MPLDDTRKVKTIATRAMVVSIDHPDEEVLIVLGVSIGMACVWSLKVANEIGHLSY
jgi:hypothetical protein